MVCFNMSADRACKITSSGEAAEIPDSESYWGSASALSAIHVGSLTRRARMLQPHNNFDINQSGQVCIASQVFRSGGGELTMA